MDEIWGIVLAAGASTRMKKQKMLLPYNGKTIIETVIGNMVPVLKTNILVVIGSHRNEIKNKIINLPVTIAENENYMNGMLSSVICGFQNLPAQAKAAMLFLGDQPQIPTRAAIQVKDAWQHSDKGIVIPTFNGRRGHPVIIDTKYKTEIEQLDPEKGLRELMKKYKNDILEVECGIPEILRDIDTPQDYSKEIKLKS